MKKMTAKRIIANISIKPTESIELSAIQISKALSVELIQNTSGKFEEFIGYEANAYGISVNLICDPSAPESPYDLDFYGSSDISGETVDITDYILSILRKKTNLACMKMK